MRQKIRNFKIRAKLYLLVGIALAGMLALGAVSFVLMNNLNGETDIIAQKWMPSCTLADRMNITVSNMRLYEVRYVTSDTEAKVQTYSGKVNKEMGSMDSYVSSYAGYVTTAEGRKLYENLQSTWAAYKQIDSRLTELVKNGQIAEAWALLDSDEGNGAYEAVIAAMEELADFNTRGSEGAYEESESTYRNAIIIMVLLMAVVILIGVIFSMIIIKSIREPVTELEEAAIQMARGNLDVALLPVTTEDEVGVVSKAFNSMVVSIRDYIDRLRKSMETENTMKEKELMMETHLKDAQIKYLQAQINPHFLFNTLNAGAQLAMMEGAERTYRYVQNVADFFRYNVKKNNETVSLRQEIALVDTYIYILNVRFSGDIHFRKEVDESLLDVQVPSMILQPIVENSVNYGIRNIDWEGEICLSVYRMNDAVCISVKDNGIGVDL